jgi:hypothetical protein
LWRERWWRFRSAGISQKIVVPATENGFESFMRLLVSKEGRF